MTRLLLCTDLDRTLLPNGSQAESSLARKRFCSLTEHPQVTLAYVSGRDQDLIKQAIKDYHIPQPDFVIADVGSSIFQIENQSWQRWKSWETKINNDWHEKKPNELQELLNDITELELQEDNKQTIHKLSYYVTLTTNHIELINLIYSQLKIKNIHANIIWSVDEIKNIGLLDILPASAGKYQAVKFLMSQQGFSLKETVFAGDSGNDLCVMTSEIQSVLVANANKDVRQLAEQKVINNNQAETLYCAQGNYLGMNGNYSAGILEGIVHYLPETENWFRN